MIQEGVFPPFLHTGTGKQFRRGYCRGVATYSIHPFFLLNIQLFRSILGVNTIDSFFSCILMGANTIDILLRGGKYSRQPSLGGQIHHFRTPTVTPSPIYYFFNLINISKCLTYPPKNIFFCVYYMFQGILSIFSKKQKNEKTRKKCPPQDGPGGGHRRTNGP